MYTLNIIKTDGHMSCGQENTHVHKCVIYKDQKFSLPYVKNDPADFYKIYIFMLYIRTYVKNDPADFYEIYMYIRYKPPSI